jgi:PadR family transcriptional regulator PadR
MGDDLYENLRMELRRGSVIVAALAQLRTEHYGYALRKALEDQGMAVDRLESQGLLTSEWREEDRRRKRFYQISREGEALLQRLLGEWRDINAALKRIL